MHDALFEAFDDVILERLLARDGVELQLAVSAVIDCDIDVHHRVTVKEKTEMEGNGMNARGMTRRERMKKKNFCCC